jgi:hypothetical protein
MWAAPSCLWWAEGVMAPAGLMTHLLRSLSCQTKGPPSSSRFWSGYSLVKTPAWCT